MSKILFYLFSGNLDPVIQSFGSLNVNTSSPSPKSSDFKILHSRNHPNPIGISSHAIGENLDRLTKQFEQFHRFQRSAAASYNSSSSDQQLLISGVNSQKTSYSSMSGTNDNWSQFTSQTSLSSLYSMNSIYQIDSSQRLKLNKDSPIGQGQFGIVYKGILNR